MSRKHEVENPSAGADEVAGIIQAAVPARLVEGGLPTEAFVADVVVSPTTCRSAGNRRSWRARA
jgi:hypothetical protein